MDKDTNSRASGPRGRRVVVTGANGFIAQHCINFLLRQGYSVSGTIRDMSQAEVVKEAHENHNRLSICHVPDLGDAQHLQRTLQRILPDAVLHLASPFKYDVSNFEEQLMQPAVAAVNGVLQAASRVPSIKRVVYASSFNCLVDMSAKPHPGRVYTAADWSPLEYDDGVRASNAPEAYRASKVAAEKSAWAFVKQETPDFDFVSLCPAMVFGPYLTGMLPASTKSLNTSNTLLWQAIQGNPDGSIPPTKGPVWVDVRDASQAFVAALETPEAGGRRFLVGAGTYSNQELADTSRERLPHFQDKIAIGRPGVEESVVRYLIDTTETTSILKVRWRKLDDCLADTVPQLFSIHAK